MVNSKITVIALISLSIFGALVGSGLADLDDSYADEAVSFAQGYVWDTGGGSPPGTWGNTDKPEEALGGSTKPAASGNAYFVSLGANPAGEIVLKFTDRMLIDGQANAGFDLAIHEFGAQDDACVYLANDRNDDGLPDSWVNLGCTATDASVSRQTGDHPPYISGNSTSSLFFFDCAGKLDAIGGWASFIKIVDDNQGRTDPNYTDGFDLNAVVILNYATLDEIKKAEKDACPEEEDPDNSCNHSCNNTSWCKYSWGKCTHNSTCSQTTYSGGTINQCPAKTEKKHSWWDGKFGKAFKSFMWWGGHKG